MRPERQAGAPDAWALLALTLAGAALRLFEVGGKSLWYDEAATWHLVQGSWREILALNATVNSAPPLYPLLLGLLTGADASEAQLRLPAVAASILAIPLAWRLAREFVSARWALVAALLVALSPIQLEYAQQVREYSMAYLAAGLVLLAALRFMDRPTTGRALAFAAAATAGICVQYGVALLVAGVNLACLAELRRTAAPRAAYGRLVLANGPVALGGIVLLLTTIRTQLAAVTMGTAGYLAPNYWDGTLVGLLRLVGSRHPGGWDLVHFAYPGKLMFALTVTGLVAAVLRPEWRRAAWLLVAPGAITLAAAMAGAYPFGGIRQDMFLMPMIHVTACLGLAALSGWLVTRAGAKVAAGVAALLIAALATVGARDGLRFVRSMGSEPMRLVVAELAMRLDAGERVYVYWGAVPAFRYYWRDRPEPWIEGAVHWSGLGNERADAALATVQGELFALLADPAPFWLVLSHVEARDADALLAPLWDRAAVNTTIVRNGSILYRVTPRPDAAPPPADASPGSARAP